MRVLLADSVREFAEAEVIPGDLQIEYFTGHDVPAGDYAAIMPDITRRITAATMATLSDLRVIANYGAGYDNIDVAAARARGIPVTNTPGVLTSATAELTWALILAAARRVGEGERLVRRGAWQGWQPTHMRGMSLDGKVLGIVGAGRIGQEVARRAPAFGMEVITWNRASTRADLDTLLSVADVVSIHLSLNAETRHLIGAAELERMKGTAILVNTARGSIVDEAALIEALEAQRIRAAALDVYEHEPRIPEKLMRLENVVLLPHLGSATEEARLAMWKMAWANLLAGLRGQPLANRVA